MGRVSGSAGRPAEAPLGLPWGRMGSVLAPLALPAWRWIPLGTAPILWSSLPSHIPPSLSSPLPRPRGSCLHSFYLLAYFLCCFTLYLIIAPHFSLYLKSRIMPASCVHFRNEILWQRLPLDELLFISFVLLNDYKLFACTRNNSILFSKFPGLQLQPETGRLGLPVLVE